jgi:hypothetical protein
VAADVLNGVGVLHVGGDLHQTPSAPRSLINAPEVGGRDLRESVQVDPPCACAPSQVLDVAAIVADGAKRNHNAEVGLSPDALATVLGPRRQELECGRLFLSRISGVGDITLSVKGRTALFVQYDVSLSGNLTIELGPEGALDLFVGGTIAFAGNQDFGDPGRACAHPHVRGLEPGDLDRGRHGLRGQPVRAALGGLDRGRHHRVRRDLRGHPQPRRRHQHLLRQRDRARG